MHILVSEETGSILHGLCTAIAQQGYQAHSAATLDEAERIWQGGGIDCIVSDLNRNTEQLTEEERGAAHNGSLAGWIWLRSRIFRERPNVKHYTIIYSTHVADLIQEASKEELNGLILIDKGLPRSQDVLLACIEAISLKVGPP